MEKGKLKVCIVLADCLPVPAVKGGAIESLVDLLLRQNSEKNLLDITVCSVYDKDAAENAETEEYCENKFLYTRPFSLWSKLKHIVFRVIRVILNKNVMSLYPHYGEIFELLKKEQFDVVITEGGNEYAAGQIYELAQISHRVNHVHHFYEEPEHIACLYNHVIGVSDFITSNYVKKLGELRERYTSFTLYNAVPIKQFEKTQDDSKLRKELGIDEDEFVVLYVGRIIPEKGLKELIEAILGCEEKVRLLVIGSPQFGKKGTNRYYKEILHVIEEHAERILYLGYIENRNLWKYQQIADIQCVPSMCEEAAGLVAIEAMAASLPTVVTKSGGMTEYITDETSLIVEREDIINNLRNAILKLKDDEKIRENMGRKAHQNALKYDEEQYYLNFCKIMENICQ